MSVSKAFPGLPCRPGATIYMDRGWDRGRTIICLEPPVRVLINGVRSELEAKLLRS